ncbi:FAST kinase domain-containing protein 5, mitochondrial [Mantella aurantiaca]
MADTHLRSSSALFSVFEGHPVGLMAVVIYRRLHRVVFQTAAISTTKYAWSKPPIQVGRCYQFKSTKVPTHSLDTNQNNLGHRESLAAYDIATHASQVTDDERRVEENDVHYFDTNNPMGVSERPAKISATGSSLDDLQSDLNLDHQKPTRAGFGKTTIASKNRLYKDIETYSTKNDPRTFQQLRPEYKSMCYNSERLMETPFEEGKRTLRKATGSLTPREASEFLVKLSYVPEKKMVAIKSDANFNLLCSTSNLRLYTNSEIISCLGALERLGFSTSHHMLTKYEQEFCGRVSWLSTDELLLVADTFRYLNFQVPKFLDAMYRCMQMRALDLSFPQLMQLIYIVGEGRHAPQTLLTKLEAMVRKNLPLINLEEIGMVCLAFFKTSSGLSNQLMDQFGDIIVENIEQMNNYALVGVLKMFRFTRRDHLPFFRRVGQDACRRVPKMPVQGIMHVVLAFATMHILDEDLMNAVALTILDRLSYCRSKDLAKFLWSFGILNFKPLNSDVFYSVVIDHIRTNLKEFESYPEHFFTCLMGLAFCQQFPLDLISVALDKTLVLQSNKISKFELKKDVFTIAGSVEIECPQYNGNTISPEFRKEVTDMLVEQSTREIYTRREVIEAGMLLQHVLGGPQYVKEHMILPHTRSKDLEVHLDANRKLIAINPVTEDIDQNVIKPQYVKITDDLLSQLTSSSKGTPTISKDSGNENPETGNIFGNLSMTTCPEEKDENSASQSEVIKLAIQVTNRNNYLYGSQQLLGIHASKRRQLRKLGYVVVEVPFWEWFPLFKHGTRSEKLAYLYQKVFGSV